MSDTHEPPMRLQKESRMLPGEDCPDCVHCHAGLHEARPQLMHVLDAVTYDDTLKMLWGKIDVDCPECGKPNEVSWSIDIKNNTRDAVSRSKWTQTDYLYAKTHGLG